MSKRSYFKFKPFSRKQRKVLNWWCEDSPVKDYDGIIADGAIRSGKTVSMSLSFVLWAMSGFNGESFAMCGKTIASFRRNVLFLLKPMLLSRGFKVKEKRGDDNYILVSRRNVQNIFYIFGGKDEGSQDLIQGITVAGIFFDEVALMPESFVNQGTGRCSVKGSKFWFNCNPGNPAHWFKKNWIDKCHEKRLLYLHFDMDDNLSLSQKIKDRYRSMYSDVFFQRNILGNWVAAEGSIYRRFANNKAHFIINKPPSVIAIVTIGFDFGGNGSAHAGVCTGITAGYQQVITLEEYYRKEVISPEELITDICDFIVRCQRKYPCYNAYFDSAETTLIAGVRRAVSQRDIKCNIRNARKGSIIERIRFYQMLQGTDRHKILAHCTRTIEAFSGAVWKKGVKDERLDDGSVNIDSLDAQEYSTETYQSLIQRAEKYNYGRKG